MSPIERRYWKLRPRVVALAKIKARTGYEVEEFETEAMAKVFDILRQQPDVGDKYLIVAARNRIGDLIRDYTIRPTVSLHAAQVAEDTLSCLADPADLAKQAAESEALAGVLRRLPPKFRDVLILDAEGWTAAEIAAILGDTVPAIKSRMYRARDAARTIATGGRHG